VVGCSSLNGTLSLQPTNVSKVIDARKTFTLIVITFPFWFTYFLKRLAPKISVRRNRITKRKNRNFAMDAAPAAMPVKPNTAAINATTKNVNAQRNIIFDV
jgi:hypothetical protein